MATRKCQIEQELKCIVQEKSLLSTNLDKLINEVSVLVDHVKSPTSNLKATELTQIQSFQLDILKRFTSVNYELETLLENPLKLAILESVSQSSVDQLLESTQLLPTEVNVLTPERVSNSLAENELVNVGQHFTDPHIHMVRETLSTEVNVLTPERVSNSLAENELINVGHHFTDPHIQMVRETFKEISQRLGLNKPNLRSVKKFYEKPSTSSMSEVCNESFKTISNNLSVGDSENVVSDDSFQIPEKDLNVVDTCVQTCHRFEPTVPKTEHENFKTVQFLDSKDRHPSPLPDEVRTDGGTDPTDSCSEKNLKVVKEEMDCNLEESSDEPHFNVNASCKFEESKNAGSILEKLNNYKTLKDELDIEPLELPGLRLKPSNFVELDIIQNQIVTVRKPQRKDKKRVDKNKIYELKRKNVPNVDDVCAFSHIESPSEFYLHIADERTGCIDDISDDMGKAYGGSTSKYKTKKEACECIQKFCAVYIFNYSAWYRAAVIDWQLDKSDEDVLIQLVDYGSKRTISFKNLRILKKEFTKLPMLAVRCHFPLMYPPESTFDNKLTEWPITTIQDLVELSGLMEQNDHKFFKIAYVSYEEELQSVAVDLFNIQNGDENSTVGEILLQLELAVQIAEDYSNQTSLGEFLQDIDILERDNNINEVISGYDARDEARICRFTKSDGTCFKGRNCKLEHIPISKGNVVLTSDSSSSD